jgi:monothiol glutaredoxin
MDATEQKIREQLASHKILIYIKGTPDMPMCGFSSRAVQALKDCGEPFAFVNILENPEVREKLKQISNWPTYPQLYLNGELVGGCDIICELHETGELQQMVKEAVK